MKNIYMLLVLYVTLCNISCIESVVISLNQNNYTTYDSDLYTLSYGNGTLVKHFQTLARITFTVTLSASSMTLVYFISRLLVRNLHFKSRNNQIVCEL